METKRLIEETITSLNSYNPKLISSIQNNIELFNGGRYSEALEQMSYMIEGMQWVYSAVDGINRVNEKMLYERINELPQHFKEMVSALENEDHTLISDLLEYEVLPILNDLQECLSIKNEN
jgi:hypothetical protein